MDAWYRKSLEALAQGAIDWVGDDIRVILIDTADYAVNVSTHDFLDDIPAGARVAVAALTGRTATDGVLDADDVDFGPISGDQSEALVIYQHTGVEGTSRLLLYIDHATGLPVTPNGINPVPIQWDNGASKVYSFV